MSQELLIYKKIELELLEKRFEVLQNLYTIGGSVFDYHREAEGDIEYIGQLDTLAGQCWLRRHNI